MKLELYFDMDEVIVNLSEHIISIYNEELDDNFDYRDNKSYWWLDAPKGNRDYFKQVLNREGTFLNPKPNKDSIHIINQLHKEGYEINITTSPQWNQYCCIEKIQWLQKYLPWLDLDKHLFFTSNKGKLAQPNRILIDDNINNLSSWELNNGVGIAYGEYEWHKDFRGFRSKNFKELYETIKDINKIKNII